MKICIAFSGGGHYIEAINACKLLIEEKKHEYFFLTYKQDKLNVFNTKVQFVTHPKHGNIIRRIFFVIINFLQSLAIYFKEKPDLIISTGADVTLCIMLIGKFFRKKIIFIESGANVTSPSLTGKIIYPYCDLFIIQWEELRSYYPKAIHGGPLL